MARTLFGVREERRFEALKEEYKAAESMTRSVQGLRYAVFAAVMAILGSLYAAYHTAFNLQAAHHHLFARVAPALIGVVALALIFAGVRLERSLRRIHAECSRRAAEIERALGVENGLFSPLEVIPRERLVDPIAAARFVALLITVAWLALIAFALIS